MSWLINYWHQMINPVTTTYGFWSGAGSDIGELAIVGGLVQIYRKHNCHVKNCWRVGKYPVEGTPYIVCKKHHPDVPHDGATMEHIKLLHKIHKENAHGINRT